MGCLFLDCVFWVLIIYSGISPDLILYYRYLDHDANHDIVVGSLVYIIRSVIILQPFTRFVCMVIFLASFEFGFN